MSDMYEQDEEFLDELSEEDFDDSDFQVPETNVGDSKRLVIEGLESEGVSREDAEFLIDTLIKGVNQDFDIDKVMPEDKVYNFGCKDLVLLLKLYMEDIRDAYASEERVRFRLENNLIAEIRDCTIEEYISNGYIKEDRELVALLSKEEVDEDPDAELRAWIMNDFAYNGLIQDAERGVYIIYKILLQDAFSLEPYKGVLLLDRQDQYTFSIDEKGEGWGTSKAIDGGASAFGRAAIKLTELLGVKYSKNRQFDVDEILKSDRPVYFPYKFVEFASGRVTTKKINKYVYKDVPNYPKYSDKTSSFDSVKYKENGEDKKVVGYYDGYIKEQIIDIFVETAIRCLRGMNETQRASTEVFESVRGAIMKVKQSVSFGVVINRFDTTGGKVNDISIRIVDISNSLKEDYTKLLFGHLGSNENFTFSDGLVLTLEGEVSSYRVFEYRQIFNEDLANAEPKFGYKVIQSFLRNKQHIGWDKILLGQDRKGTPVFASLNGGDDIPFQSNTVHNIIAGSRSGKGVMTMNILASAVADRKPIFYLDRKPDMSIMFYELAGDSMFIINGGDYTKGDEDVNNYFSDDGTAISGWKTWYNKLPNYAREKFFNAGVYNGVVGDMVYYRAIILTLAILCARVSCSQDIREKLGGEKGIVIIIDEFKNWQKQYEQAWFNLGQGFVKEDYGITTGLESAYTVLKGEISAIKAQLGAVPDDGKPASEARRIKLETQLKTKSEELSRKITPEMVYASTLMSKLGSSMKRIDSLRSAGFSNSEGRLSDIFIIGQDIELDGYCDPSNPLVYPTNRTAGYKSTADLKNRSPIRGLLNSFPGVDWFMGYNHESEKTQEYCGVQTNSTASKWIDERRFWMYSRSTTQDALRTTLPADHKFFTPYLVLNKHYEDDPDNPSPDPKYTYIRQVRNRLVDLVGENEGRKLWSEIRKKHIAEGDTSEFGNLSRGIGFQGMIECLENRDRDGDVGYGDNVLNAPDFHSILGESGQIADFVARSINPEYQSYKDYLFDFTPTGIYSIEDIINILNGSVSPTDYNIRLPYFVKYGLLGNEEEVEEVGNRNAENIYADEMESFEETDDSMNAEDAFVSSDTPASTSDIPSQPIVTPSTGHQMSGIEKARAMFAQQEQSYQPQPTTMSRPEAVSSRPRLTYHKSRELLMLALRQSKKSSFTTEDIDYFMSYIEKIAEKYGYEV